MSALRRNVFPGRWQEAFSDWFGRWMRARHDRPWQLDDHALRDIGLSGRSQRERE